jgi:2-oxo-4-hydroxy-4-carboxy-5-ureidoimidazoline decarboxylase
MTLAQLNAAPAAEAATALERCCGTSAWVAGMLAARPVADHEALHAAARRLWRALPTEGWREAFTHHPRIGDVAALRAKFARTAEWAGREQAGAVGADEHTLEALAAGNRAYETRFGHIFIVCATGKTAADMLELLRGRLGNEPVHELRVAAGEQERITAIRLDKLLEEPS